jgi:hypothetical protein
MRGYPLRLGYLTFNAGVVIKVQGEGRSVAQRIVDELDIRDLIRAGETPAIAS